MQKFDINGGYLLLFGILGSGDGELRVSLYNDIPRVFVS